MANDYPEDSSFLGHWSVTCFGVLSANCLSVQSILLVIDSSAKSGLTWRSSRDASFNKSVRITAEIKDAVAKEFYFSNKNWFDEEQ